MIPLLLNDTPLPAAKDLPKEMRPLVRRQTALLRSAQFEDDVDFLAKRLEEALGFYHGGISPTISKGLDVLRERIEDANIPPSTAGKTINLATWNIRYLGRHRADIRSRADTLGQGHR